MNIKILISVIIIVIVSLIIVFKSTKTKNPKQLELTYRISVGIPFRWEYEIEDESIVKFVKKYVVKDENVGGITGAPVYTNYVFEGLKEGTTTITFKYVNFAEEIVTGEEKNIIKVDKDNNITLIETTKESKKQMN